MELNHCIKQLSHLHSDLQPFSGALYVQESSLALSGGLTEDLLHAKHMLSSAVALPENFHRLEGPWYAEDTLCHHQGSLLALGVSVQGTIQKRSIFPNKLVLARELEAIAWRRSIK